MTGNEILNRIKLSGIDVDEFMDELKLLEITADIIHSLTISLKDKYKQAGLYRHEVKQDINILEDKARKYVSTFDNVYAKGSPKAQEKYGELSDEILEESLHILKNHRYK